MCSIVVCLRLFVVCVGWLFARLLVFVCIVVVCFVCLVGWLVGWLVGRLFDRWVGWSNGLYHCLVCCWLVGWLPTCRFD